MVNKVIIVGNLGKDPEVRFGTSGKAVCKFPVATSEKWTDQDGQKQESVEWHNVVVFSKQAETCGQYLAKGRQVYVEGKIQTRQYDDKDGNRRYIAEVVARDVRFLGGGRDDAQHSPHGRGAAVPPRSTDPGAPTDDGDTIPF